jgi:thiol-disulfide isomerase/thioredoxin
MRLNFQILILITVTFALSINCSQNQHNLTELQIEIIENYIFSDWHGNEVPVTDFEGAIVVIDFWESWCGPCLSAFPGFQRALNDYPGDIVIIAATAGLREGREEALRFQENQNYNFLFVDGTSLGRKLGLNGIPFKIILDRNGKIKSVHTGSLGAEYEYELLTRIIRS